MAMETSSISVEDCFLSASECGGSASPRRRDPASPADSPWASRPTFLVGRLAPGGEQLIGIAKASTDSMPAPAVVANAFPTAAAVVASNGIIAPEGDYAAIHATARHARDISAMSDSSPTRRIGTADKDPSSPPSTSRRPLHPPIGTDPSSPLSTSRCHLHSSTGQEQSPTGVDCLKGAHFRAVPSLGPDSGKYDERSTMALSSKLSPAPEERGAQLSYIQFEVATLTEDFARLREEVNGLRASSSLVEMRQTEISRHLSLAQVDIARETMAAISLLTMEQQTLKQGLQERSVLRSSMASTCIASILEHDIAELRADVDQRNNDVLRQLTDMRASLHQQIGFESTVHEDSLQLSADMQDLKAQLDSLRDKPEGDLKSFQDSLDQQVRQLRQRLDNEVRDRQCEDIKTREAISAVSGESQACYTQLKEDIEQSMVEHEVDFSVLQDILREHTTTLSEQASEIYKEKAVQFASHGEIELKLRKEMDSAVGAQRSLINEARHVTHDDLQSLRAHVLEQDTKVGVIGSEVANTSFTSDSTEQAAATTLQAHGPANTLGGQKCIRVPSLTEPLLQMMGPALSGPKWATGGALQGREPSPTAPPARRMGPALFAPSSSTPDTPGDSLEVHAPPSTGMPSAMLQWPAKSLGPLFSSLGAASAAHSCLAGEPPVQHALHGARLLRQASAPFNFSPRS